MRRPRHERLAYVPVPVLQRLASHLETPTSFVKPAEDYARTTAKRFRAFAQKKMADPEFHLKELWLDHRGNDNEAGCELPLLLRG